MEMFGREIEESWFPSSAGFQEMADRFTRAFMVSKNRGCTEMPQLLPCLEGVDIESNDLPWISCNALRWVTLLETYT